MNAIFVGQIPGALLGDTPASNLWITNLGSFVANRGTNVWNAEA